MPTLTCPRRAWRAVLLLVLASAVAGAQTPTRGNVLRGRAVHAGSAAGIADVQVRLLPETAAQRSASSGSDGRFALVLRPASLTPSRATPAPTRVVLARIGFAPETLVVPADGDLGTVRMHPAALALDAALVRADRAYTASTSNVIRRLDIATRPRASSQELLQLIPGLVIAQHAGGGKAEQIFLRGFDADHGTDVAISVDDVPVNLVSHAHGQGYADLHFLLPDVIERVDVRKGPFDARDGNFATAGAVRFVTRDRIDAAVLRSRGGNFGVVDVGGAVPFGSREGAGGFVAAELQRARGPFEAPQAYRRVNLFGKWTAPLAAAELFTSASAFDARWDASGQVPQRAVTSGRIGRFGAIDPTEGGATSRYDAQLGLRARGDALTQWSAKLWATRYRFDLYSNFTFFLDDSINGDGIQQVDDRTVAGLRAELARATAWGGRDGAVRAGLEVRHDDAVVGLYHQRRRTRLSTRADARLRESHLGVWAAQSLALGARLRGELGLRGDVFRFLVADRATGSMPVGGPSDTRAVLSPKLTLAYDAGAGLELFAAAGSGFHSNDARDAVAAPSGSTVLPRARSGELGARHSWSGGSVALSGWRIDLESELVWSGDGGVTEASGRSMRQGLDAEARLRLLDWLWLQTDASFARGRFVDEPRGADRIPLAPDRVLTAALLADERHGVDGGLRVRHIGSRAADETADVIAEGQTIWSVHTGYRFGAARVVLAVDNLFNARWNEAQFATTSRLAGEALPVTELHFTPGAPRSFRAGMEFRF